MWGLLQYYFPVTVSRPADFLLSGYSMELINFDCQEVVRGIPYSCQDGVLPFLRLSEYFLVCGSVAREMHGGFKINLNCSKKRQQLELERCLFLSFLKVVLTDPVHLLQH